MLTYWYYRSFIWPGAKGSDYPPNVSVVAVIAMWISGSGNIAKVFGNENQLADPDEAWIPNYCW